MDTPLRQGDIVLTVRRTPPAAKKGRAAAKAAEVPAKEPEGGPIQTVLAETEPAAPRIKPRSLQVILNDTPLYLPAKENGLPYYLMDLLQYSGIDFDHLDRPVHLDVNGEEKSFRYELREQDVVHISVV